MSNPAFTIPLPKSWPAKVRSAMLHVVSLAKYAVVYTRSWAADCPKARVRFRAERDRHQEDNALLREELRIKDARMAYGKNTQPNPKEKSGWNLRIPVPPVFSRTMSFRPIDRPVARPDARLLP